MGTLLLPLVFLSWAALAPSPTQVVVETAPGTPAFVVRAEAGRGQNKRQEGQACQMPCTLNVESGALELHYSNAGETTGSIPIIVPPEGLRVTLRTRSRFWAQTMVGSGLVGLAVGTALVVPAIYRSTRPGLTFSGNATNIVANAFGVAAAALGVGLIVGGAIWFTQPTRLAVDETYVLENSSSPAVPPTTTLTTIKRSLRFSLVPVSGGGFASGSFSF